MRKGAVPDGEVTARPYAEIAARLAGVVQVSQGREKRMQALVDALWEGLGPLGVSWVGFYLPVGGGTELILGPRRDKPACSPIGLHGVCGRAFVERRPIVVEDVRALGESYIACDPADRSEVVVPVLGSDDAPWAVLDLDSHQAGFFTQSDVRGLEKVLAAAFPAA